MTHIDIDGTYVSTERQQRISSATARAVVELIGNFSAEKTDCEAAVNGLVHALGFITGTSFCARCEIGWMAFINKQIPHLANQHRQAFGDITPCTCVH